jgi:hypothetical protein
MKNAELTLMKQVSLLRAAVQAEIRAAAQTENEAWKEANKVADKDWQAFEQYSLKHSKAKNFKLEEVIDRVKETKDK